MATGDGLLVRVRPRLGRLTRAQMLALCDAAETWGSGLVELTRRGNLQLRGVSEAEWPALMACLVEWELVAADAEVERQPALLVTPDWQPGDVTHDAARRLQEWFEGRHGVPRDAWPRLPAKWGLAIDAGPAPVLTEASADLRLERAADGRLLVRADGRSWVPRWTRSRRPSSYCGVWRTGSSRTVAPGACIASPCPCLPGTGHDGARRAFRIHRKPGAGRASPRSGGRLALRPGVGLDTACCARVREHHGGAGDAWRRLLIEGEGGNLDDAEAVPGLIHDERDPRLAMDACPGAPHCERASVATRELAQAIAERRGARDAERVHVSGCAKGCARGRPADICLTGRDGRFDLILGGCADDAPVATGLSEAEVLAALKKEKK